MGCLILFVIFPAFFSKAWWLIAVICLGLGLQAWHKAVRINAERQRARAQRRRAYEAGLGRRIARTQREIARTDAELGLGSAPLSAVNADTLERLAVGDHCQ